MSDRKSWFECSVVSLEDVIDFWVMEYKPKDAKDVVLERQPFLDPHQWVVATRLVLQDGDEEQEFCLSSDVDKVVKYYADKKISRDRFDEVVIAVKWFVDPAKGKVLFELTVAKKEKVP